MNLADYKYHPTLNEKTLNIHCATCSIPAEITCLNWCLVGWDEPHIVHIYCPGCNALFHTTVLNIPPEIISRDLCHIVNFLCEGVLEDCKYINIIYVL